MNEMYHRQHLGDFLKEQDGYYQVNHSIYRPDNTLAATRDGGKWITSPTPDEMAKWVLDCGRGLPSKLADIDLTNPGHNSTC